MQLLVARGSLITGQLQVPCRSSSLTYHGALIQIGTLCQRGRRVSSPSLFSQGRTAAGRGGICRIGGGYMCPYHMHIQLPEGANILTLGKDEALLPAPLPSSPSEQGPCMCTTIKLPWRTWSCGSCAAVSETQYLVWPSGLPRSRCCSRASTVSVNCTAFPSCPLLFCRSYNNGCYLDSSLYPELADIQWCGQEKAKPGTLV